MSCNCLEAASYLATTAHALPFGEFVNKEHGNAEFLWQSADDSHLFSLFFLFCMSALIADSLRCQYGRVFFTLLPTCLSVFPYGGDIVIYLRSDTPMLSNLMKSVWSYQLEFFLSFYGKLQYCPYTLATCLQSEHTAHVLSSICTVAIPSLDILGVFQ